MRGLSDVELLERMVDIPSPSGAEGPLAAFLAEAMTGLGMSAEVDEVGNVVGRTGTGDGPTVVLLSHIDTIADPMPAHRTYGRIHGRGAGKFTPRRPAAAAHRSSATAASTSHMGRWARPTWRCGSAAHSSASHEL